MASRWWRWSRCVAAPTVTSRWWRARILSIIQWTGFERRLLRRPLSQIKWLSIAGNCSGRTDKNFKDLNPIWMILKFLTSSSKGTDRLVNWRIQRKSFNTRWKISSQNFSSSNRLRNYTVRCKQLTTELQNSSSRSSNWLRTITDG